MKSKPHCLLIFCLLSAPALAQPERVVKLIASSDDAAALGLPGRILISGANTSNGQIVWGFYDPAVPGPGAFGWLARPGLAFYRELLGTHTEFPWQIDDPQDGGEPYIAFDGFVPGASLSTDQYGRYNAPHTSWISIPGVRIPTGRDGRPEIGEGGVGTWTPEDGGAKPDPARIYHASVGFSLSEIHSQADNPTLTGFGVAGPWVTYIDDVSTHELIRRVSAGSAAETVASIPTPLGTQITSLSINTLGEVSFLSWDPVEITFGSPGSVQAIGPAVGDPMPNAPLETVLGLADLQRDGGRFAVRATGGSVELALLLSDDGLITEELFRSGDSLSGCVVEAFEILDFDDGFLTVLVNCAAPGPADALFVIYEDVQLFGDDFESGSLAAWDMEVPL